MRGPYAGAFERVISQGGVVLFPSDTVYGLACDPSDAFAIERLYELKGRDPEKAAAVMFFELDAALAALPEIGERTRRLLRALLPGPLTALVSNPASRFALACADDHRTIGLRVVAVPALAGVRMPVLQSSANLAGSVDASRLADVEPSIIAGADLVVDGGDLPGVASTVLDLRGHDRDGSWTIIRHGPVSSELITVAVGDAGRLDGA